MPGDFNYAILRETAHRPWPMPASPWLMTQTWHDLLFAHWQVEPAQLRRKVPGVFELDAFDGSLWIGVVPFRMTNVSLRGAPALPGLSAFPELNVRTYVRVDDRPGVYFFSLDAGSLAAVIGARALLNLPYFSASMAMGADGDATIYRSRRRSGGPAEFEGSYGPLGPARVPVPGTLEYFLTERYCLYHVGHRGRPYRLQIHHPPWPLQRRPLRSPGTPWRRRRQDVAAWGPEAIRSTPAPAPGRGPRAPL